MDIVDAQAQTGRGRPRVPGVYIHVPFCLQKCRYCDFFSVVDPGRMDDYVTAVLQEMTRAATPEQPADTLYFGGGTPSLLSPGAVARIIQRAARHFNLSPESEITLEVNPGTVSRNSLAAFRRAGVNRLNVGIQSFDDARLAFLGRIHNAEAGREALAAGRDAGFDNIGLDLIYALPDQGAKDWEGDLAAAVAAAPEHLSCYTLTFEPGTPLDRDRAKGRVRPLAEGRAEVLFRLTVAFLAVAGYTQYEVSNFARSRQYRSRHNAKYWHMAPYTGLGPAAHSFSPPDRRWWNVGDLGAYLRAVAAGRSPMVQSERLTREQQMVEAIYLGLRQTRGVDVEDFNVRFGVDFFELFAEPVGTLSRSAMLESTAGRCALTPTGMVYLDSVAARLVDFVG